MQDQIDNSKNTQKPIHTLSPQYCWMPTWTYLSKHGFEHGLDLLSLWARSVGQDVNDGLLIGSWQGKHRKICHKVNVTLYKHKIHVQSILYQKCEQLFIMGCQHYSSIDWVCGQHAFCQTRELKTVAWGHKIEGNSLVQGFGNTHFSWEPDNICFVTPFNVKSKNRFDVYFI